MLESLGAEWRAASSASAAMAREIEALSGAAAEREAEARWERGCDRAGAGAAKV